MSAKKLKLVFLIIKSFEILVSKLETDPRVIKLSNKLFSVRKISISPLIFPPLTLLFKKLVRFEGLKTDDIFLIRKYLFD